ncbi:MULTISPECIES: alpha-D-ribose 1-methylphosphonate 5-triphosphate diphosphatase [Roseobacteraceae]|uniref:Alpha-D-ribose 1-methylphosphonate 5-triphosphate diphosphatase n=1 Tax=Pseudosulfitobacter pseudonitzschiae TaxID=1402135 RepID=A0A221JXF6_9RHOB|nr:MULTISPECIES: alpha-D-ribose 1-methylphosphonate 5-triphosphate diphosphatase [Roseobacteraceae]ASM71363.1 alpha-D-ribose 1-methylphosphonate 5-triphosphate diphosphatase [Pseudosulfitobacter pseudonitzschiae]
MTQDTVLTNARVVLPDEVITGTVVLRDGKIADVASGGTGVPAAQDCGDDYLAPGLIELHTDNLERHMVPRPKVDWPHRAAILAHDRELAGTGITTVFDAIRVGSILSGDHKRYGKYARQMADEILDMRNRGALKISHHIHLRAEICSETLEEELDEFGADDKVGIVSLMDHTPGQRQFRDVSKFETYVRGKHNMEAEGFAEYIEFLYGLQAKLGTKHEAAAVAAAGRYGATLASHDDTTAGQVAASHAHGVAIAEFPTTVEAAEACRASGIATMMGAPNLVRGGSHSGNVAAQELAAAGLLDIVSSDYVPAALLLAAMQLADVWDDMARAIATVTATPARSVGLMDRGEVVVGKRADLIRFGLLEGAPLVQAVWSEGRRVA